MRLTKSGEDGSGTGGEGSRDGAASQSRGIKRRLFWF